MSQEQELIDYAADGNLKEVKRLITQGIVNVNIADKNGKTPLHHFIIRNDFGVKAKTETAVKFLIDNGANIDAVDKDGITPLHLWASFSNSLKIGELLLDKGANVNMADKNGATPLREAYINSDIPKMELLLDKKADVNEVNKNGDTLLHLACSATGSLASKNIYPAIIRLLLRKGANVYALNNNGLTPLNNAMQLNHIEAAELLLDVIAIESQGMYPTITKNQILPLSLDEQAKITGEVPQKIHFIWLGSPIPQKYLFSILKLLSVAGGSDFTINLWVDKESNYWEAIKKATPLDLINSQKNTHLRIRNINELSNHREIFNKLKDEQAKKNYPIHNNDKELSDVIDFYFSHETVGLKNYAAASDLLRYAILYLEGGYYFDTDTEFLNLTSKSKLTADYLSLGIRVGLSYYIGKLVGERLSNLKFSGGGNDTIAALPRHPVFKDALLYSTSKYLERDSSKKIYERYLSYADRLKFTLNYTGPYLFYECINSFLDSYRNKSLSVFRSMLSSKNTVKIGTFILPLEEYIFELAGITVKINSDQTWLRPIEKESFDDSGLPNKLSFNFFSFDEKIKLEDKKEKEENIFSTNIQMKK